MTTRTVPPGHESANAADEGLDFGTWATSRQLAEWPAQATADPPAYPFNLDRHVYGDRGPLMAERLAQ